MTTAIDVARAALALWRQYHGDESLDDQCIRYAGYYCDWAGHGHNDRAIAYSTATAAYRASSIVSMDPDAAPPGARHWFRLPSDPRGHVGFAHGSGIMSHTGSSGDDLGQLGNHVKMSTVRSYNAGQYLGWSYANGANPPLLGLTDSTINPVPEPAGGGTSAITEEEEDNMKYIIVKDDRGNFALIGGVVPGVHTIQTGAVLRGVKKIVAGLLSGAVEAETLSGEEWDSGTLELFRISQ